MTTIAFDGHMLAADTQITAEWKTTGHSKFYRFHDGSVGAFAGTWSHVIEAQRFLDELTDVCPSEKWYAIILHPDGTAEFREADGCRLDITGIRYAIGSGSHSAMAAMECGRDARGAVEIAARLDPYTGLPVETITVAEVRPVRKTSKRKTTKR